MRYTTTFLLAVWWIAGCSINGSPERLGVDRGAPEDVPEAVTLFSEQRVLIATFTATEDGYTMTTRRGRGVPTSTVDHRRDVAVRAVDAIGNVIAAVSVDNPRQISTTGTPHSGIAVLDEGAFVVLFADPDRVAALEVGVYRGIDAGLLDRFLPQLLEPCLTYQSLSVGDSFAVGESFTEGGITVTVEEFSTFGDGPAVFTDEGIAPANSNLRVDFGRDVDEVTFQYVDHGGGVSLGVNGALRYTGDLRDFDGEIVGGAAVTATPFPDAPMDAGYLSVAGDISDFVVGGSELRLGVICGNVLPRIPVLFVHGHSGSKDRTWIDTDIGETSFAAVLEANPQLRIDPFYLELPLHGLGHSANRGRSIALDAVDIQAAIEGGADSEGEELVGILNMPSYRRLNRLAIVANSQGALSSRLYVKNLMGQRRESDVTVTELVTLAAPNHGLWPDRLRLWPNLPIYVDICGRSDEPDRARRQLCAGRVAAGSTPDCGECQPLAFATNTPDGEELQFVAELNGHDFAAGCNADFSSREEAPFSRPVSAAPGDGVLYVNLFAAERRDELVGGEWPPADCMGRGLAWNHAPDAENVPIPGLTRYVHARFPHHWPAICMAIRSVVDRRPPILEGEEFVEETACAGLRRP